MGWGKWEKGQTVNSANVEQTLADIESGKLRLNGLMRKELQHFAASVDYSDNPVSEHMLDILDRCWDVLEKRKSGGMKKQTSQERERLDWQVRLREEMLTQGLTSAADVLGIDEAGARRIAEAYVRANPSTLSTANADLLRDARVAVSFRTSTDNCIVRWVGGNPVKMAVVVLAYIGALTAVSVGAAWMFTQILPEMVEAVIEEE